jgi:hypothetical protein
MFPSDIDDPMCAAGGAELVVDADNGDATRAKITVISPSNHALLTMG